MCQNQQRSQIRDVIWLVDLVLKKTTQLVKSKNISARGSEGRRDEKREENGEGRPYR